MKKELKEKFKPLSRDQKKHLKEIISTLKISDADLESLWEEEEIDPLDEPDNQNGSEDSGEADSGIAQESPATGSNDVDLAKLVTAEVMKAMAALKTAKPEAKTIIKKKSVPQPKLPQDRITPPNKFGIRTQ